MEIVVNTDKDMRIASWNINTRWPQTSYTTL